MPICYCSVKREWLRKGRWLTESREDFLELLDSDDRNNPNLVRELDIRRDTKIQFWRRIVLHDPILASKAEHKVSFLDMFHSPDFIVEDFERLWGAINMMDDGLVWWKDATLEAIAIRPSAKKFADSANVGRLGKRFSVDPRCPVLVSSHGCRESSQSIGGVGLQARS